MQYNDIFLNELFAHPEREITARITALNFQEKPMEFIEGKITGGSINIDGNSILRRTCSLSMVAQDVNINQFYWGLYNKFQLEIGLKNKINPAYPETIWFKQGIFIITNFNTTYNINSYNISISGKDKMCLLNGEIAGTLPHTTDFGIEEYDDGETITYTSIPIRTILTEMLQNFGNELIQNIVINDLEDAGMDLLEYRGDVPLYLLKQIDADMIENITMNGNLQCYKKNGESTVISNLQYDTLTDLSGLDSRGDIIYLTADQTGAKYTVVKLEYGSIAGYRLTDLVYAGDLIANAGESITSVLDKIVQMLGNFEYFYDLDGKFIFQRKKNYNDTAWNSLIETDEETYVDAFSSPYIYNFLDNKLIISFQNTPNLLNLKNDYVVWGKKTSASGIELDIHMRYAIDKKPTRYKSVPWYNEDGSIKKESREYTIEHYDWRELIYQMALDYRQNYHRDDFLYNVAYYNPDFTFGKTGYEQYYVDLEGFWRLLYNPQPYTKTSDANENNYNNYYIKINNNYIIAESFDKDTVYYELDNNYYLEGDNRYWSRDVVENPENLIFWFDFLDAEDSDISQFSVPMVGSRSKVINDDNVKNIYYRNIPQIIFISSNDDFDIQTGYASVKIQPTMENLFTISSKAKSCKERINELLYTHSYCAESVNITAIPIYHLEPNHRILVQDKNSNINGEYVINKITIPLTYNGTMTMAGVKAVSSLN